MWGCRSMGMTCLCLHVVSTTCFCACVCVGGLIVKLESKWGA